MSVELKQPRRGRRPAPRSRITGEPAVADWKVGAASAALFFERAWPAILPALGPLVVLAALGLFDVFGLAPGLVQTAALGVAGAASACYLWRYGRGLRPPTRADALRRLEEDGRLAHAPLRALEDRPFAGDADGALWRAHLDEQRAAARRARIGAVRAVADARDPLSLRFGAIGLLVVAFIAAGPEWNARLARAFSPAAAFAPRTLSADLWIEPPAYVGKAPVYLLKSGERIDGLRAQIDVPEGSLVVAQTSAAKARLNFSTGKETTEGGAGKGAKGRLELKLADSGLLTFSAGGARARWPIAVAEDDPPEAAFIEDPATTDDSRVALALAMRDDYGIAKARLEMRLDGEQERATDQPPFDAAALREIRRFEIDGVAGAPGDRRFDLDLQSDPFAGLEVYLKIIVVDGAGQEGASEEAKIRLPERPFFNPLARAVIEQRRTLAVAGENWPRALRSFEALTLAPDRFYEKSSEYLLMRSAFWRVMRGAGENLDEAVSDFWPLAMQLEDENLELARQRLQAAQQKLKEALERGATDAEISRLVEALRAALQQYLAALQQSGAAMAQSADGEGRSIDAGDLESMLDSIRDLSKAGARGAARQALDDLENILKNLRLSGSGAGGRGQGGQSGERGAGGLPGEAGDLIGRQRELADRAFEEGQSEARDGGGLAGEEGGLADELTALIERLKSGGAEDDPDGKAARALKKALDDMRGAEAALRADSFEAAGTSMENAIANLREGAGAIAEAQGGRRADETGAGDGAAGVDPLGRPTGEAYGRGVDVPETSDLQRAREVLDELRRRLSDGKRAEDEIKYLERLLERF